MAEGDAVVVEGETERATKDDAVGLDGGNKGDETE